MSIPDELKKYGEVREKEDAFVQQFLIPLLQRLGFSSVANYHGTQEAGKDLVFAEVDRFSHVRYHGLQAKYVSSIGKSAAHDLVKDCVEAFTTPFRHPNTGKLHPISTFYVANAGDISDEAEVHFYNSFRNVCHEGNVFLLDGKSLVALDKGASYGRSEMVGYVARGMLLELAYNDIMIDSVIKCLAIYVGENPGLLPIERLRNIAMSNYLIHPMAPRQIKNSYILGYKNTVDITNAKLDFCLYSHIGRSKKQDKARAIIASAPGFKGVGEEIRKSIQSVLSDLGRLTGL